MHQAILDKQYWLVWLLTFLIKYDQWTLNNEMHHLTSDLRVTARLIAVGANVNKPDIRGETLLHKASSEEETAMLVDKGANIHAKDYDPLHSAADSLYYNVVRLLLQHGANPRTKNNEGETPADLASGETKQLLVA